ncbi:hypothetical protein CCH79_00007059 [Gambusia affinis]|uniref:Hcy-binding domain-containing protein n=1 Tax=Gambusia affinis TaxID=33528 RepID=A0A315V8L5_GAMAF|nr:hypothetical protein CCH79_00007059 [Gambusia affinis]
MAPTKKGILERLNAGEIVIGDGGFVFALEKRGYVKAGPWTPEATVTHPEAVRQLHREFVRAGANIMQAFTFYASDDKLENRGQALKITGAQINEAACDLAREVANEGDALVAGGVSQTPSYLSCKSEPEVKAIFRKQLDVFVKKNVDFLIAEYFEHVEEAEWAVQVLKTSGKPVAASLCIGPEGDMHGVSPGECAVRLVKAGAQIVGVNCHFDPLTCVKTVKMMKEGVEKAGLKAHYMVQPLAYHTPDCNCQGFIDLPEFPFALEPRILTRWDMHQYAREAYNAGIRYIGGCCGYEPYHIRAVSEELAPERGFLPAASEKHGIWGAGLEMHTKPWVRARSRREYWENIRPASGHPKCPSLSTPESWGVTKGHSDLLQHKEATSTQEMRHVLEKQKKGILERLNAGEIVIGDGGFVFALEKRGYVKAGPWTPEAAAEHPEAVRQLHREFLRAGANVMQTFTFYASDDKLENRGNKLALTGAQINEAACDLAREVASEGDALVAGGVSQTPSYLSCKSDKEVKAIFKKQLDVFTKKNVDFLIAEVEIKLLRKQNTSICWIDVDDRDLTESFVLQYFEHVEEAVWAVEVLKESGKPVAASLCIGPDGDMHGNSPGDCAAKLVKAGAQIVGVNCHFDPLTCVKTVKMMKEGVEKAGLKAHYMVQPLAYHTPDCNCQGFIDLPEFPFALEPRILTRWDMHQYAREAYNAGIRYIGGCCGYEPYHIRAVSEELAPERGFLPAASEKHGMWGAGLEMHTKPWVRARARRDYWEKLKPASGRPLCPSMSAPDSWGVTRGHADLMQQKEATTKDQLKQLFDRSKTH